MGEQAPRTNKCRVAATLPFIAELMRGRIRDAEIFVGDSLGCGMDQMIDARRMSNTHSLLLKARESVGSSIPRWIEQLALRWVS